MNWPQPFPADVSEKLVIMPDASPAAVAQYRQLADTLLQARAERGVRTVMIASADPGDGRTLTAVNLALTLSESCRQRVLLADADLRHPGVHHVFQVSGARGLRDYLATTSGTQAMPVIEVTRNLTLLPAGRPGGDAIALLGSSRLRALLTNAASRFDWVILDSAPLDVLPDPGLLAAIVDVVVLVVAAHKTPREHVQRAIDMLGRERIAGVVLNRVAGG